MGVLTVPRPRLTVAEYLALDRASEERHELADGQVLVKSGASLAHNRIVANLVFSLRGALGDGPCYPLATDMRVRAGATRYVYPDIVVVCGDAELEDSDVLLNPSLVFEVLSETTEAHDRGAKFAMYRELPSLRAYVLVSQHARPFEQFVRQPDDRWLLSEARGGQLALTTLSVALDLDELYCGVGVG